MLKIDNTGNRFILMPQNSVLNINHNWFDVEYWRKKDAIVNSKLGRAPAWFIQYQNGNIAVLKHYWRGGLIGKVLNDQYLFLGLEKTRVYKEFKLLLELKALNLPVPDPIAAYVEQAYGIYRADILTQAIPSAQSLCEKLQQSHLSESELVSVGQTIADFHRQGVYHDDLNINNILFDGQDNVNLIDFDKGEIRAIDKTWQQDNIDRLARSFKKEAGKWPTFFFDDSHWQVLLQAYKKHLNI
ncbi:3-deoxy-D-manno-octulosonic acid kinase [Pseudoalteromonas umbrosa]|uniref:3-deoxy-D-manno-octulosonic acid kinase n=1 Tax=Pseudoalteromonas umbrosa TaxID=3048489 RepID=UPI0024C34931|nr:3-deoxy-D-manno-octulosonic acid kinase [Pseudoalteromonas sp. B95]MDK1289236.1 3-deoxy-D-manno-octulosonic acid kinase [Pseudoalteromonas sp. B95]